MTCVQKHKNKIRAISKKCQKTVLASANKFLSISLKVFLIVGSVLIADLYPSFLAHYINQTYENKKTKEPLAFSNELNFELINYAGINYKRLTKYTENVT